MNRTHADGAGPCLVIFDCDGTLIDSQHVICAAMVHAFESQNRTPPSREATLSIVGLSLFEAVHRLVPDAPADEIRAIGDAYKECVLCISQRICRSRTALRGCARYNRTPWAA